MSVWVVVVVVVVVVVWESYKAGGSWSHGPPKEPNSSRSALSSQYCDRGTQTNARADAHTRE